MTRRMRAASIVSEASRNVVTGTAHGLALAAVFIVVVGLLAAADVRAVVGVLSDARAFRTSGAATTVLKGPVDGARCSAIAGTLGTAGAAALRPGSAIRPLAMPSTQITNWQVTPGMVDLLEQVAGPAEVDWGAAGGVWVASDLADDLGVQPGSTLPTDQGAASVVGVFTWPDDGRDRDLGYSVLSPVPAVGSFTQCWAQVWPLDSDATGLLYTAVATGGDAADGQVTLTQLNSTHGTQFDGPRLLANRLTRPAPVAAALGGLSLGWISIRRRRLELSSSLHARVPRADLAWQHVIEAMSWVLPAALILCAAVHFIAGVGGSGADRSTWAIGVRIVGSGAAAAILATLAATLTARESYLYRYAKDR